MALMDKPKVISKVHSFMKSVKLNGNRVGKIPRSLTINYNNLCNFKCHFCFSADENNKYLKDSLPLDVIKDIADQAHDLGVWEIVLTGGELTINKAKLIELIRACGPERFQMVLITNGYLLTEKYANELKTIGLDCVAVSISGMNAEEHDRTRVKKNSHVKALEALKNAQSVGLAAWPNVIYGHYNAFSDDLISLLEYSKKNKYSTYLMMAMPYGSLKDDVMDSKDIERLNWIRKNYNTFFNTWDMYDRKKEKITGCWTVNRTYISPLGDVFPCPYIPIKLGNILEQPFEKILKYGFSIKYFGGFSPICIAASNLHFRKKFLKEDRDVFHPYEAKEIFSEEDYEES